MTTSQTFAALVMNEIRKEKLGPERVKELAYNASMAAKAARARRKAEKLALSNGSASVDSK